MTGLVYRNPETKNTAAAMMSITTSRSLTKRHYTAPSRSTMGVADRWT